MGKVKEKYLVQGIAEYVKRLGRYCTPEIYEVVDEKTPDNASPVEEQQIRDKEGARLMKGIPDSAYVIALDIRGKMLDSVQLSEMIGDLTVKGNSHIVFVIGGSIGLSEEILRRADYSLSFSRMTFPHQLMRMILLEQVYRSFRILHHEPYHK